MHGEEKELEVLGHLTIVCREAAQYMNASRFADDGGV
jgi:hypothetical protein